MPDAAAAQATALASLQDNPAVQNSVQTAGNHGGHGASAVAKHEAHLKPGKDASPNTVAAIDLTADSDEEVK